MFRRGVSCKGFTSRPPVPEECEVNRLHAEAVKKQKDAEEAAAAMKRKRKEKHDKALVNPPLVGAERRSPTPAAGRRSPTPAAGGR